MGVCHSTNSGNQIIVKPIKQLVSYFKDLDTTRHPDISQLIREQLSQIKGPTLLEAQYLMKLIYFHLNKENNCKSQAQKQIQSMYNTNLTRYFSKIQDFNTLLGQNTIILCLEILIFFQIMKRQYFTKADVWWNEEHFRWRYNELQDKYGIEYLDSEEQNYLIKFLNFLRQCIDLEFNLSALKEEQLYFTLKIEFLNTIPSEPINQLEKVANGSK